MTVYSDTIEGSTGNHYLSVEFDLTDGIYLGITQPNPHAGPSPARVLLCRTQIVQLIQFIRWGNPRIEE